MGARPSVVSKQMEANGYLEKSRIDSRKTPVYDKNGKVFGYAKKAIWTVERRLCTIQMIT